MRRNHFIILQVVVLIGIRGISVWAEVPLANADFNDDGRVDLADFAVLSSSWMTALPWSPDGLLP